MFHGNAAVERSFSFNKEFLVENLQEHSLIAQRSIHEYARNFKKVTDIDITKPMITAFKSASHNRTEALNKKKTEGNSLNKRKREIQDEINSLNCEKTEALEIVNETEKEIKSYDNELKFLEASKSSLTSSNKETSSKITSVTSSTTNNIIKKKFIH